MHLCLLLLATLSADDTLRVGFHKDLFRDIDPKTVSSTLDEFSSNVSEETKHPVRTEIVPDAHKLCQALHDGKYEFAALASPYIFWELARFPDLQPLVVAINQRPYPRVVVLRSTKEDRENARGQPEIGYVSPGRPHAIFFATDLAAKEHARLVSYANAEDLLDDTVDGKVPRAAVDLISWQRFQARKPVRARLLRIDQESPEFLPSTVLYRKGAVAADTVRSYRDSLVNLKDTVRGRDLMTSWRMTAFEDVRDDFAEHVTALNRAYPDPRNSRR